MNRSLFLFICIVSLSTVGFADLIQVFGSDGTTLLFQSDDLVKISTDKTFVRIPAKNLRAGDYLDMPNSPRFKIDKVAVVVDDLDRPVPPAGIDLGIQQRTVAMPGWGGSESIVIPVQAARRDWISCISSNDIDGLKQLIQSDRDGMERSQYVKKSQHVSVEVGTPLVFAAVLGNVEAVRVLLEGGADANNMHPIREHLTHGGRNMEIIELLLKHGSKPTGYAPDAYDYVDIFPELAEVLKKYLR